MDTCPDHPEVRPQRKGTRSRKDGTVVARYWCPRDGGHSLQEVRPPEGKAKRRTRNTTGNKVLCRNKHHRDSRIVKNGVQRSKSGTWQRWLCLRPDGTSHSFQTLIGPDGTLLVSNTPAPSTKPV